MYIIGNRLFDFYLFTLTAKEGENGIFKKTIARLNYKSKNYGLNIPFSDNASIENCLHIVNYMLSEGFVYEEEYIDENAVETIVHVVHKILENFILYTFPKIFISNFLF